MRPFKSVLLSALILLPAFSSVAGTGLSRPEEYASRAAVSMDDGRCSGTAIDSPKGNVVLTASHCIHGEITLVRFDGKIMAVSRVIADGNDHSLIVVKGHTFRNTAEVGPRPPIGSSVFIFGNSMFEDFFRRGTVTGYHDDRWNPPNMDLGISNWMVLDMLVAPGDSGSGVFDDKGRVVGVITGYAGIGPHTIAVALPFKFKHQDVVGLVANPGPLIGK